MTIANTAPVTVYYTDIYLLKYRFKYSTVFSFSSFAFRDICCIFVKLWSHQRCLLVIRGNFWILKMTTTLCHPPSFHRNREIIFGNGLNERVKINCLIIQLQEPIHTHTAASLPSLNGEKKTSSLDIIWTKVELKSSASSFNFKNPITL